MIKATSRYDRTVRLYFTLLLLFFSATSFAVTSKGKVDSLKNLVETSLDNPDHTDTLNINRLNQLAANYFDFNPDSTLYYGLKAVAFSRKVNYQPGIADGLVQTGHAHYFKGKFEQATRDFNAAIVIYKRLNDQSGLSKCYVIYGRMYSLLAKYKFAHSYLNQALSISKQLHDEKNVADCYKNIGIVYFNQGQLPKALDYYYKALFIDLKTGDNLAAAANYNDIGFVLYGMGVYPKSLEYYKKALSILEGTNHLLGIGTVNENIGEVYLAQKNYDVALPYLFKAIKIAEKQDDKDGMSSVYTDVGLCYANKNDFKKAVDYLSVSLQVAQKYKIVYNEAYTLIGFATVYNLQKDYKKAYAYAFKGQQLAKKLGNLAVRSNAALQLNKTMAGLGKYDDAYKLLRQYIDLKDSLNNNLSIQKLTSYNLELNFVARKNQLAAEQHEKDLIYQQKAKQQKLINTISVGIIFAMIVISLVYYRQKLAQQKINAILEDKNREILEQKANLSDQAQKLNELNSLKDNLMSVLAHDLRSPLSTLRGLFGLLQDHSISHQELLDMIPQVSKNLEYTSDFLDTLLFWINSQMENFDNSVKGFNVKDIVAHEAESFHEQASLKGINLVDNVPCDVVASADPNSIRIVIRNLITNAIKFSSRNDTIEISAWKQDDQNNVITVKDTGTGMTNDQLSKLFKSKVSSKTGTNNESGTGMGLLFCKDLVEKCHGKIWATSKPGQGTEFAFTIPVGMLSESKLELA